MDSVESQSWPNVSPFIWTAPEVRPPLPFSNAAVLAPDPLVLGREGTCGAAALRAHWRMEP